MTDQTIGPIVGLWCAVIIRAICDIEEGHKIAGKQPKKKRPRGHYSTEDYKQFCEGAADWLYSDSMEPASFLWICEMCDLDARKIREMSYTREGRKRLSRTNTLRKGVKVTSALVEQED